MRSPNCFSFLTRLGGFSAACKQRFRFIVPHAPLRVGVSTCMSSGGMPIFSGKRVLHSSTTVLTIRSVVRRHRKKKSPLLVFRSGASPWFTAWAFRMM